MFDRYTNFHGLRNLIWLWNSVTPSWYPGADVVDILGYDSYPAIGDHGPVDTQYQELIALGNDTKMVTLPEVGNIPDPAILKLYHADWSYFVTWDGDYIDNDTYNALAFKEQVYNDPTVLKLTDLGAWKGTATVAPTSSQSSSSSSSSQITSTSKTSSTSQISSTSKTSSSSKVSSTSKTSIRSSSKKSTASKTSSTSKTSTTRSAPVPTQSHWGQCGGTGYTGPTICAKGTTCTSVSPPWYYQCL
jgi:mannan endo-1,4-beta-mannosidase